MGCERCHARNSAEVERIDPVATIGKHARGIAGDDVGHVAVEAAIVSEVAIIDGRHDIGQQPQHIVARAADQRIVAAIAVDDIIALQPVDQVPRPVVPVIVSLPLVPGIYAMPPLLAFPTKLNPGGAGNKSNQ